jgi:hypothetical protein
VAVFVIATVIISLYASGYKFNLSWPLKFNRLLLKTGMLIVDSSPNNASIYLNDREQTNRLILPWKKKAITTAAKIKNILPGEYNLRLEREGYWPFQKKITIYSGQSTFAENINLFRSDLPFLVATSTASQLSLSTGKKYLFINSADKIIDLKNSGEIIINSTATSTGLINPLGPGQWLKTSEQLLTSGQLIDPSNNRRVNYQDIIGQNTTNWFDDEATNHLYYQFNNSLAYYDISKKTSQVIFSTGQLIDYQPINGDVFLIAKQDKKISLFRYELATDKTTLVANLPNVGKYNFVDLNYGWLELYDQENKTLYLINPQQLSNSPTKINNIVSWQWRDANTILYNNSWEMRYFDLKTGNISLVTRVGEQIVQIIWNKSKNYLIYSTDKSLNTIDLANGITTEIFKTEKILSPILDEKGNSLYFWAKVGQQEGVYRVMLQ